MSTDPTSKSAMRQAESSRERLMPAAPWLWLALSAAWAVAIFATELPAWSLAIWIAATLGPITLVQSRE